MTVLTAPPGSPLWMSVGADLLLLAHITGGGTALVAGAVALAAPKGETLHRISGTVFFLSMLMMAAVGAGVAPFLSDGQRANTVAGVMTFYLVLTAWTTVQRQSGVDRLAIAGFAVALGTVTAGLLFAMQAAASPTGTLDDSPPQAFYIFMIIGGFAALGDLKVILQRSITGNARIARHIWRMCTAYLIAAGSFFLGQQQVLPAYIRGSIWQFLPIIVPLLLMIYWLVRVRFVRSRTPREVVHAANE